MRARRPRTVSSLLVPDPGYLLLVQTRYEIAFEWKADHQRAGHLDTLCHCTVVCADREFEVCIRMAAAPRVAAHRERLKWTCSHCVCSETALCLSRKGVAG